eukprot:gene6862-8196_t
MKAVGNYTDASAAPRSIKGDIAMARAQALICRGIRFYLVDKTGSAVPAVLGEERETRDGHYMYRNEASFAGGEPLCCSNLSGVHQWLRAMMPRSAKLSQEPRDDLLGTASDAPDNALGKRQRESGDGDAAHSSLSLGRSHAMASKLARTQSDVAQPVYRRQFKKMSKRAASLAWVREMHLMEAKEAVETLGAVLVDFMEGERSDTPQDPATHPTLTEAIEVLRQLRSVHMTLHLLEDTRVADILTELARGGNAVLAGMAETLLKQWLAVLFHHAHLLSVTPPADAAEEAPPLAPAAPAVDTEVAALGLKRDGGSSGLRETRRPVGGVTASHAGAEDVEDAWEHGERSAGRGRSSLAARRGAHTEEAPSGRAGPCSVA